jgi:1-acyl-sn-glycerol-3-phosphate acyltransferase
MWLLPHLSAVSAAALRVYYRASRDGAAVPASGPVLLVGNHPNSLLDPAFLAWAAGRPVRFLAKAPLFTHPLVGWLVRGSGAIPVYRAQDDPTQTRRNLETFRAVHEALGAGSAVALFPEGISHSAPALAPLKTGAARIALGALPAVGHSFPIIPVGLVFRAKDRFRSQAHAVVGAPIPWEDLAARSVDDHEAVRELTARIERSMRQVTLNLARWEDESVVRTAEAVWSATHDVDQSPGARVVRLATTADVLARLRAREDPRWDTLARDVREHARVLRVLGLRPADVQAETDLSQAARWALRRLTIPGIAQGALAAIAIVLFWIPYRLTGFAVARATRDKDTVSTYRVLGGTVMFLLWIAGLAALVVNAWGWLAGLVALLALPLVAIAGLIAIEHSRWTLVTARRWLIVRRGDPRINGLRPRQLELSRRLDDALAAHEQAQ